MITDQKVRSGKITISIPQHILVDLAIIPRGERSHIAAEALVKEIKLRKFKMAVERLASLPKPIKLKIPRLPWRKPIKLNLHR